MKRAFQTQTVWFRSPDVFSFFMPSWTFCFQFFDFESFPLFFSSLTEHEILHIHREAGHSHLFPSLSLLNFFTAFYTRKYFFSPSTLTKPSVSSINPMSLCNFNKNPRQGHGLTDLASFIRTFHALYHILITNNNLNKKSVENIIPAV